MRRREFITLLGGVAAAWPLAALAQQIMLAVGFLSPGSPEPSSFLLAAFREGLKEASYIEGNNVTIEYRWARCHYDELESLAADLVRRRVAAIAATGGTISAQAARAATSTIPIVFNVGDDPIKSGLVASFNRPGGNITGVNTMSPALETKRLGLLRELVPSPGMVAVLLNAANPDVGPQRQDINAAATAVGQELRFFYASNESDLEAAFGALVRQGTSAAGESGFASSSSRLAWTLLGDYISRMCGRIIQSSGPLRYAIVDGMNVRDSRVHNYPPRWNAAPSHELLVIRRNHRTGEVSLDPLRWGLIPYWCNDPAGGRKPINAKCETVRDLPTFRDAYRKRRCIVPVDGFFEWKAIKGQRAKQPYATAMKDGTPFGLAGIWENWRDPASGEWLRTFAIITTDANELVADIHHRMPVVLAPADYPRWLGEEPDPRDLMRPFPADLMRMWPISTRVNKPENDDPQIVEPIELATDAA